MSRRRIPRALLGAVLTGAGQEALIKATSGKAAWERNNYRGRAVNLSGGVAAAVASIAGAAAAPAEIRSAALVATCASAATGGADDFSRDPAAAKGLTGHLKALSRGQVTTGAIKLLGISAAALISGGMIAKRRGGSGAHLLFDTVTTGALIAGSANLINLFDLRPGRALKVTGAIAIALAADRNNVDGRSFAHTAAGVVAGAARRDLNETTMLGDVGANSLGTLLGLSLANHPHTRVRMAALLAVTGLILASEKVSFSKVIEGSAALSRVDRIGRAP